jgi:hypothetical protein
MGPLIRRLSLPCSLGVFASALPAVAATPKAMRRHRAKGQARASPVARRCQRRDVTAEIGAAAPRSGNATSSDWHNAVARRRGRARKAHQAPGRLADPGDVHPDDLAAADVEAREAHLALRRLLERVVPTAAAARRGRRTRLAAVQILASSSGTRSHASTMPRPRSRRSRTASGTASPVTRPCPGSSTSRCAPPCSRCRWRFAA